MNTRKFIPFARPCVGEEEIQSVVDTMRSGWLTTGPKTLEFEKAFSLAVNCRHAMAVNSATAGLHLALEALGVGQGDLVIVPTWTFTATAEVVHYLGAIPVFLDVKTETLNIDAGLIESKIADLARTQMRSPRAVIPVHFSGQACEMEEIMSLSKTCSFKVIEDAAHAFPCTVKSASATDDKVITRNVGSVGDATVFSFYATKTIATGEGGMVTTECAKTADRIRLMRLHGINKSVWNRYNSNSPAWKYEIVEAGYKYNLTDVASSIGITQLRKANSFLSKREEISRIYNEAFKNVPCLEIPVKRNPDDVHSWHLYVVRLNLEMIRVGRDQFIQEMSDRGVGCSVHFIPLHLQPYWRDRYQLNPSDFPVASREFERSLSLPIYPSMTEEEISVVVDSVLEVVSLFRK